MNLLNDISSSNHGLDDQHQGVMGADDLDGLLELPFDFRIFIYKNAWLLTIQPSRGGVKFIFN